MCIRCTRLNLECQVPTGGKKKSTCVGCAKAKEKCEWLAGTTTGRGKTSMMSPRGGEKKKRARSSKMWVEDKDEDNEEVEVTGTRGGRSRLGSSVGESLAEVLDRR